MESRVSNRRTSDIGQPEPLVGPRGPVFPRLDLTRISPHLPQTQRIRIEINGCLCGAPLAIPDAVTEFATGWAFANRFFDRHDQVSKISATATHVSLMVAAGCDLDRRRYEAIGWIPRQDLIDADGLPRAERLPRAVPVMTELDAVSVFERTFGQFDDDGARAGYTHAGLATVEEVTCVARDLGPDAALYKVLGWALASGAGCESSALVLHGVVDAGQVEAAARAGIPIVATDAVPTTGAIDVAKHHCITLVGLARSTRRGVFVDGGHLGDPSWSEWEDLFGSPHQASRAST
jgi:formate dehydrogenase accessory protein FdhD